MHGPAGAHSSLRAAPALSVAMLVAPGTLYKVSREHSGSGVMPKVSGVKAAANGRALAPKARLDEQDGVHGRLGVLPGRRRAQRDLVPLLAPHMLGLGREAARGGRGPEERGTQRLRLLCQRSRRMRPSQQPVRAASQRGARKLGRHREFV